MINIYKIKEDSVIFKDSNQNVGTDPILEFDETSRVLFKLDTQLNVNNNYLINFTIASSTDMVNDTFSVYPITSDWTSGYGKIDIDNSDNVTWFNRQTDINWTVSGGDYDDTNVIYYNDMYNSLKTNKVIFSIDDFRSINIDLGLLLKWDNTILSDKVLMLYSKETHTIYYPKLIEVTPQIYNSYRQIIMNEMFIVYGINNILKRNATTQRFRFSAKDSYIMKDYSETNDYINQYDLPSETYISLTDLSTNDVIVPFDDNIQLDCDKISNYIDINLSELNINRYYNISIKVVMGNIERVFNNFTFYLQ